MLVAVVVATLVVYPVTQGSVQEEAETQARDEAREGVEDVYNCRTISSSL